MTTNSLRPKIRPLFKPAGMYHLANWIIENFPPGYEKLEYIEAFAGPASILINKEKGPFEAVIDRDLGTIQIFRALRDEPEQFISKLKRTKFSEKVFLREQQRPSPQDYFDHAFNEFILRRMSRGGLKQTFAGVTEAPAWKTLIKQLKIIAERLQGTYIFNKPAVEVISAFDAENILYYCNPPLVPDIGEAAVMSTDEHIKLSEALHQNRGKALITNYACPLYKRLYSDWRCVKLKVNTSGKVKTEHLWVNY